MRLFRRACLGVLLLAVVVLAARLAWLAGQSETAPGLLLVLVRNASLGWIGLGHQPIASAPAREQAEFWQAEAERIVGAEPESQLALGAAWMLDQPTVAWGASIIAHPSPWFHRAAHPSFSEALEEFEKLAAGDCLRWTERAAQLDADRPEVWRCRAELLFLSPFFHSRQGPRTPAWQSILTTAEQHDAGNGLYAALAANTYWDESLQREFHSDGVHWVVTDEVGHAEAVRCFQQALDAPFIIGSTEHLPAVCKFVERSRLPKYEIGEVLGEHVNYNFSNFWLCNILAQRHLERAQIASGPEKLQLLRQYVQLLDQVANFDHLCAPGFLMVLESAVANRAIPAIREAAGAMSSDEIKEFEARLQRIQTKIIVAQYARTMPTFIPVRKRGADTFWYALAVGHAWPLVFLFSLFALAISLLAWLLGAQPAQSRWRHATLRHVGCWLTAALISFVLFGVVPGQLIDVETQETVVAMAAVLLVVAILGALLLAVVLTRRSQRTMLAILVVMLFLGALAGRLPPERLALQGWTFDGRAVFPTVEPINPALGLMRRSPSWTWAVVQWCTYPGPLVTVGLGLTLIAVWRWHWTWRQGKAHASRWSCSTRASLVEIRRSTFGVALLSLVFFLVVAPDLLTETEANYQAVASWYRQYPERRAAYLAAVEVIQNDPAQMALYRREARKASQLNRQGLPLVNSPDSDASESAGADEQPAAD